MVPSVAISFKPFTLLYHINICCVIIHFIPLPLKLPTIILHNGGPTSPNCMLVMIHWMAKVVRMMRKASSNKHR